ncbi:NUDIX hydrolase [Frankia sp. R82]|uniref:NUDIX hydrolase n=1 Tax=Frankia sp. R82 TaxID=2950553 RepID=UPI002042F5D5|nr:NUDIX hydrolase [Frankia sp. R82]MCM3883467.1 NUDIX hydrolase [Frankia sp. R82]
MTVTNNAVIGVALSYIEANPDDVDLVRSLIVLALHGPPITARSTTPAHVTCRAAVVSPDWRVLEVVDTSSATWQLPTGHLAAADVSLLGASLRLASRHGGVDPNLVIPDGIVAFDVDAMVAPAAAGLGEPEHVHYAVTYLFHVEDRDLAVSEARAHAVRWVDPGRIPGRLGTKLSLLSRQARLVR